MTAWRVIIQSMTPKEVDEPRLVDSSRAKRIAHGSGRTEKEVRELVNQYFSMRKMMKQMKRRGPMMKGMPFNNKYSYFQHLEFSAQSNKLTGHKAPRSTSRTG